MNAGGIELAMRKRYDKEFKAKVALEALKGEKTLQELALTYSVHPNMIGKRAIVPVLTGA